MNRLHIVIIALFAVALGTGIVVGMGMTRMKPPREGHSWLSDQLGLTPEQSTAMRAIWEDVRGSSKPRNDSRLRLRKDRDEALQALLTPEQKAQYAGIIERYNAHITDLNRQQDAEFLAAADRTKKILNDHQRAIYEDLLKKGFRGGPGGPREGRGGGPPGMRGERGGSHRGPEHGSSTAPAESPATMPSAVALSLSQRG